jgi:hypothetical protein
MYDSLFNLQRNYGMLRPYYSNARLRDYSVMERGGIVRYTPDKELTFGQGWATEDHGNIKNYMFSIENLAWKDAGDYYRSYLSKEQKGPFGGRIMWFPPYNLKFTDNTNTSWKETRVLGRIEPLYTYSGCATRKGTLNFSIVVDHPSVINLFKEERVNILEDDVEQALLRFFAGCDTLTNYLPANLNQEWKHYDAWTETSVKQEVVKQTIIAKNDDDGKNDDENPKEKPEVQEVKCVFLAFYPNNVSGYQDVNQKSTDKEKMDGAVNLFENKWNHPRAYEMKQTAFEHMGGELRYIYGRPPYTDRSGIRHAGEADSGALWKDIISYDKVTTGGERVRGESLCDSVDEVWRQNNNTKFDREDFGLNTKVMAEALTDYINDAEDYKTKYNKKTQDAVDKVISKLSIDATEYKGATFFSIEDIKGITDLKSFCNNERLQGKLEGMSEDTLTQSVTVISFGSASSHGSSVTTEDDKTTNAQNRALGQRRAESLTYYLASKGLVSDLKDAANQLQKTSNNKVPDVTEAKKNQSHIAAKAARAAMVVITYKQNENMLEDGEHNAVMSTSEYKTGYEVETIKEVPVTENKIKYYDWSEELDQMSFDNEFLYFDRLKNEKDNIIYKQIKEKVRFFDPAFHSITPEGFNARLTFLHQCCRPGPTNSAAELNRNSSDRNQGNVKSQSTYGAGNLAFGRPPVCVLRLGDFFFSKILIDSMSIDFGKSGGLDLNPEGIGVQPMIANVNLNITFIGGQDITGPIAQLQNAVSSNFYANASIYDKSAKTNENGLYRKGGTKVN